jgi:alpha-galactosidase
VSLREIGRVPVNPESGTVYEHGWQSWSPSGSYPLGTSPPRPLSEHSRVTNWRPEKRAAHDAFWGEGLLAVDPGDATGIAIFAAAPGADPVPSIRADVRGAEVVVSADGPTLHTADTGATSVNDALGRWAEQYASAAGVLLRPDTATAWCSWYHYFTSISQNDIVENVTAMGKLGLDFDVVQIDDGYQEEIGDWLSVSEGFGSLQDVIAQIRQSGRRAGIWVAPFLVSPRSRTYHEHPEWLVGGATAGRNWQAEQAVLDVTHPGAADHLRTVFTALRRMGIDYFKLDFLYAGALPGHRADDSVTPLMAYRHGLQLIRETVGPGAYLLGCGAPILPSIGLVDAMRVSPDTGPGYEPADGDLSTPSQLSATLAGQARAWQNGRFWVNDPDCLIARPQVEHREEWAAYVIHYGGHAASSDRILALDEWGLEVTRRLLDDGVQRQDRQPARDRGNRRM